MNSGKKEMLQLVIIQVGVTRDYSWWFSELASFVGAQFGVALGVAGGVVVALVGVRVSVVGHLWADFVFRGGWTHQ